MNIKCYYRYACILLNLSVQFLSCMESSIIRIDDIQPISIESVGSYRWVICESNRSMLCDEKQKTCSIIAENKDYILCCAVNKQGTKIALGANEHLTVYNTQTLQQEWCKDISGGGSSMAFDPVNDTDIVLYNKMSKVLTCLYSDGTKKYDLRSISLESIAGCAYHHHKKEIAYGWHSKGYRSINYENEKIPKHSLYPLHNIGPEEFVLGALYSWDGTFCIVLAGHREHKIVKLCAKSGMFLSEFKLKKNYSAMSLHSNNRTVFLLSNDNELHSYDVNSGTMLYNSPRMLDENQENLCIRTPLPNRIALSCDGKQIGLALSNCCLIIPLSLGMLYGGETKECLLQRICLLRLWSQQDAGLLEDIGLNILEKLCYVI